MAYPIHTPPQLGLKGMWAKPALKPAPKAAPPAADRKRLNAWTKPMMDAWQGALRDANADDDVKAVVLTGAQGHRDVRCLLGSCNPLELRLLTLLRRASRRRR